MTTCPCGQIIQTGRSDKKYCDIFCLRRYRKSYYKPGTRNYHKWSSSQLRYVKDNLHQTDKAIGEHLGLTRIQVWSFRRRQKLKKPDDFSHQFGYYYKSEQ